MRPNQLPSADHRRTVVSGGSGHVGTFLVPRLVAAGYHVMVHAL